MSLAPLLRFQPVEHAPQRRRIDRHQFRESLLGEVFVLRKRDQRSALHQVERQRLGAFLKMSSVEAAASRRLNPRG
jgi:hypothetical protein